MSEYIASIQATLNTDKAKSEFESFKSSIQNQVIKISLDADFKGSNTNFLNSFSKQMQSSAQSAGQASSQALSNSFNKGIKSAKFNNPIDFANFKKQNQKEISDIAKEMKKSMPKLADKDAQKWASEYVSSRQKAYAADEKALKQYINTQKKEQEKLISSSNKELAKQKTALSSAISNNSYADSRSIKEAQNYLSYLNKVNMSDWSSPDKKVEEISKKVNSYVDSMSTSHKTNLDAINKQIEAEEKAVKQQQELAKIRKKESASYANPSADPYKEAYQSIGTKSDIQKEMSEYYKQLEIKAQEQAEKTAEIISKTQENVFSGAYSAKASTLNNKLSPYANQTDNELINEAKRQAELYTSTLDNLKRNFDDNDSFKLKDEEVVQSFNTMEQAAKKFDNTMTEIKNTQSKDLGLGVADRSANQVKAYYEENSKALKKYGNELKDLENRYRSISTEAEKLDLDNQFKNIKSQISAEGLTGKSFTEEIGRAFKQIGQFAETYGVIQQFQELVSESISELKGLDDILTEISKTSDLTSSELKELGDSAFDSASKYGKTATDYLTGVQEMSRSGFYGEQAKELAELSILGQAAGDMTADVSNAYLLATNAAYQYNGSVEKLNATLDGQNMITNRNSVSMDDMAQATTEAASMANQAGVKVDELSALIGTAVSRTKESGSEVGTALKALFVNLQNTQNDKIVDTFDSVGISMTKMVGDSKLLKTPIELLRELSEVYNSLPEGSEQKANILTNIGGKHHANTLSSVLVGMGKGDFDAMIQDYSEGLGSAAVEAEKSANNWSGSLNKLKNSWTDLVANFAESETMVSSINILNKFVSGIDDVTESLGALKTVGLSVGLMQGVKGSGKPDKYRIWVHKEYVYATGEFSGDVYELCAA